MVKFLETFKENLMTMNDLRSRAKLAFEAGVKAADPATALKRAMQVDPLPPKAKGQYLIIAAGKAACKMADAAIREIPNGTTFHAIAITNPENASQVADCNVIQTAHPVPDRAGLIAGESVIAALEAAGANDTVIMLISGGSSSLLPAPAEGLLLEDKMVVNEILLSSGLDIYQMNLVRQTLSKLKGGKVLDIAHPARVKSFILSDVLGDDLRVVGSGPSVGPIGSIADARRLLIETGNMTKMPDRVRAFFEEHNTIPLIEHHIDATLIGGNFQSLTAMAKSAQALIMPNPLEGDVKDAAQIIITEVLGRIGSGPIALAFGGETTVQVKGAGRGGRNQELALQFAKLAHEKLRGQNWCFLSGGTDGRDGPTDAAGGIVDQGVLARIAEAGGDFDSLLENNDSYQALLFAGDLLMTGGTGTNVADLQLFLMD